MYLKYDQADIDHLKKKDRALAAAMDRIGPIERPVEKDLYEALVNSIVGQQISSAAHRTIWKRMRDHYGTLTPEKVCASSLEEIQRFGISFRKASYILENSQKILSGAFDLQGLAQKSDREVTEALCSLKGIGVWTAEMLMIFSMERPDILSYGDLAIQRGMRMLYRHRKIDRARFEKYRRRYSPKGSLASLYLWAIASGAYPEWSDPATPKKK